MRVFANCFLSKGVFGLSKCREGKLWLEKVSICNAPLADEERLG
jgi:hypothetical protein